MIGMDQARLLWFSYHRRAREKVANPPSFYLHEVIFRVDLR